jgi:hypothetical protein
MPLDWPRSGHLFVSNQFVSILTNKKNKHNQSRRLSKLTSFKKTNTNNFVHNLVPNVCSASWPSDL